MHAKLCSSLLVQVEAGMAALMLVLSCWFCRWSCPCMLTNCLKEAPPPSASYPFLSMGGLVGWKWSGKVVASHRLVFNHIGSISVIKLC